VIGGPSSKTKYKSRWAMVPRVERRVNFIHSSYIVISDDGKGQ